MVNSIRCFFLVAVHRRGTSNLLLFLRVDGACQAENGWIKNNNDRFFGTNLVWMNISALLTFRGEMDTNGSRNMLYLHREVVHHVRRQNSAVGVSISVVSVITFVAYIVLTAEFLRFLFSPLTESYYDFMFLDVSQTHARTPAEHVDRHGPTTHGWHPQSTEQTMSMSLATIGDMIWRLFSVRVSDRRRK